MIAFLVLKASGIALLPFFHRPALRKNSYTRFPGKGEGRDVKRFPRRVFPIFSSSVLRVVRFRNRGSKIRLSKLYVSKNPYKPASSRHSHVSSPQSFLRFSPADLLPRCRYPTDSFSASLHSPPSKHRAASGSLPSAGFPGPPAIRALSFILFSSFPLPEQPCWIVPCASP